MRRLLFAWMALLSAVNVWRVGEAISLARAIPDLATATPPLLLAAYGFVCAILFAGCAGLVFIRYRWAPLASALCVVLAFMFWMIMRAGLVFLPETGQTLGFHVILNVLALLLTIAFARAPHKA